MVLTHGCGKGVSLGRLVLAFVTLVPWLAGSAAYAQTLTPYRARMSLGRVYEVKNAAVGTKEVERIPTVRVHGRIRSVGFVDAHFTVKRNKTWTSSVRRNGREVSDAVSPVLLQGSIAVGGGWRRSGERILPTAASIIGNQLKVTFPGRAKGSRGSRQRVYTIKMTLDGSIIVRARISSVPRSVGRRGACGAAVGAAPLSESVASGAVAAAHVHEAGEVIPPIAHQGEAEGTVLTKVVTISTDADPEWFRRYGDQSNAVIASIINTAEAVYNRQLGIRFRIVRQHVYSDASPYTTSDSGRLLSAFTRNPENAANLAVDPNAFNQDVDLRHLFTGKDLDGSVIGIAYIGVVCAVPSLAYGITQAYMDVADPGIFAHELGHNFGANHDASDRSGLMYPSISVPPAQKFSNATMGEINGHLSKYGSCISFEYMTPRNDTTPPGLDPNSNPSGPDIYSASLKLRKSRAGTSRQPLVKLSGKLLSSSSEPISAVGVRLMVAGELVGKTVTSASGRFDFFVRMDIPRGKKVYVYVETEGGEVYSNFIWLGRTVPPQVQARRRSGNAHA
jgi:hypothetical protein